MKVPSGAALVFVLLTSGVVVPAQNVFQFAGYTFDQRNTPNQAALLGNSQTLGDAQLSSGLPTTTTGIIPGFPQNSAGFNGALALGSLTGLGSAGTAVNIPAGNNGTANRQGIEVGWSGYRGLTNLAGDDFLIYEASSTIQAVEGFIVRARSAPTAFGQSASWTAWYYFPPDSFQITTGVEGVFADAFDFSDFGVASGEMIDRIQMANVMQADRVVGPGTNIVDGVFVGTGRVVFDGSSTVQPDAGLFDTNRLFDAATWDPDPLYVAALSDVVTLPTLFTSVSRQSNSVALDVVTAPGVWRIESTDSLAPTNWQFMQSFTNLAGGLLNLLDSGQNGRPLPQATASRFYRLKSE